MSRTKLSLIVPAMLASAAFHTGAQTLSDSWTNTFDTSSSIASWNHWYDLTEPSYNSPMVWDGSVNNTSGNPSSGSLLCVSPWPGHAAGQQSNGNYQGQDQMVGSFAGGGNLNFAQTIDAAKYDSVAFDLKVDPSSPTNSAGHICVLTVGFLVNNYSVYTITNITIPTSATNGWTHYVCPINKSTAPTPPNPLAAGIGFNINAYGGENSSLMLQTTPTKMWIDNIVLKHSTVAAPPPTLSPNIITPIPGLNLFSTALASGDIRFQRTSIKLINTFGTSWLGQSGMTYSFTITNFPSGARYPGYQAHLFLTTGPGNADAMDYNETNVVWLNVQQNANGTAFASFRYKINEPNANSNMFGAEFTGPVGTPWAGTVANLGAPTVLGTWSLTFNQDTNVTITGPGGVSTNFNIRPEIPQQFIEPVNVVFGAQPNEQSTSNPTGNVGQDVVFADATVTNQANGTSIVYDNFMADTALDTSTLWTIISAAPNTVLLFPNDPAQKLVKWSLPDAGFGLQTTTNLSDPNSWVTLSGPEATGPTLISYAANGLRNMIVPSADLGPNQDFFRLFTRRFTKLQVLMPGETAAPGTSTGKTGTPDPQFVGVPFNITVNAVDNNWNLAASASDTIHITSSDSSATLPPDAALSGGTASVSVTFGSTGSFTITASDVTDATKTPGTGSSTSSN